MCHKTTRCTGFIFRVAPVLAPYPVNARMKVEGFVAVQVRFRQTEPADPVLEESRRKKNYHVIDGKRKRAGQPILRHVPNKVAGPRIFFLTSVRCGTRTRKR